MTFAIAAHRRRGGTLRIHCFSTPGDVGIEKEPTVMDGIRKNRATVED
jgi:hypothetical protein